MSWLTGLVHQSVLPHTNYSTSPPDPRRYNITTSATGSIEISLASIRHPWFFSWLAGSAANNKTLFPSVKAEKVSSHSKINNYLNISISIISLVYSSLPKACQVTWIWSTNTRTSTSYSCWSLLSNLKFKTSISNWHKYLIREFIVAALCTWKTVIRWFTFFAIYEKTIK